MPTLIVQSAHGVIAPLAVSHYINEQRATSRMVVIGTNGHCPRLTAPAQPLATPDKLLSCQPLRTYPMATTRPVAHYFRGAG